MLIVQFVDNVGFSDIQHGISIPQFLAKVKDGLGYAIVEVGQFQVHIGVYKKC